MIPRTLATVLAAAVAFGCAAPAAAPSPTPAAPSNTVTPSASAAPESGALSFQVESGKAIVRVREQLAGLSAPNDAVLEVTDVKGAFGVRPDGTFTAGSKISVGLEGLRSDSSTRDNFIKGSTLAVRRFPTADFVPVRTVGLPAPLPASGEWTFQVLGRMTIAGVEKDVSWDVRARRDATGVTTSAKNVPTWKFSDFGLQVPRVASVLSIVDEIRLELDLVAREVR